MKSLKDEFYMQALGAKKPLRVPMRVPMRVDTKVSAESQSIPCAREHYYKITFGHRFFCRDADIHDAQKNVYRQLKEYLYGDIQGAFLLLELALLEAGATLDPAVQDMLREMRQLLEEI